MASWDSDSSVCLDFSSADPRGPPGAAAQRPCLVSCRGVGVSAAAQIQRVELRLYRRTRTFSGTGSCLRRLGVTSARNSRSDLVTSPPHFVYIIRCEWEGARNSELGAEAEAGRFASGFCLAFRAPIAPKDPKPRDRDSRPRRITNPSKMPRKEESIARSASPRSPRSPSPRSKEKSGFEAGSCFSATSATLTTFGITLPTLAWDLGIAGSLAVVGASAQEPGPRACFVTRGTCASKATPSAGSGTRSPGASHQDARMRPMHRMQVPRGRQVRAGQRSIARLPTSQGWTNLGNDNAAESRPGQSSSAALKASGGFRKFQSSCLSNVLT